MVDFQLSCSFSDLALKHFLQGRMPQIAHAKATCDPPLRKKGQIGRTECPPITQAKRMSPRQRGNQATNARNPDHMHGRGPLFIYRGLNQWQHSGTSQIHSRQVTANATVETAVVDAPSLT